MKVLGYELILRKVRHLSAEEQLMDATDVVNQAWAACRKNRAGLSLWIEWADKELVITEVSHRKVYSNANIV